MLRTGRPRRDRRPAPPAGLGARAAQHPRRDPPERWRARYNPRGAARGHHPKPCRLEHAQAGGDARRRQRGRLRRFRSGPHHDRDGHQHHLRPRGRLRGDALVSIGACRREKRRQSSSSPSGRGRKRRRQIGCVHPASQYDPRQTLRNESAKGERIWGKSLRGYRCRWTASSPGRTMAPGHRWVTAVSDSSRGTQAATPTEYRLPGTEMVFEVSSPSAELLREAHGKMGAFVTERRTFGIANG